MKRILGLLGILGVVAAIVGAGYFFRYGSGVFERPESVPRGGLPEVPRAPQDPGREATAAGVPSQTFGVVGEHPVRDFFVGPQNEVVLVEPTGQIVLIRGGQVTIVSSSTIPNLFDVSFSADGQNILALSGDRASPLLQVFDLPARKWQALSTGAYAASWSPTDRRIVYVASEGRSPGLYTLDVGNPRARPQLLASFRAHDLVPHWHRPTQVFLSERGTATLPGSLLRFDVARRTMTPILEDRFGLQARWNPNLDQGLLFFGNAYGRGGELVLTNGQGAIERRLNLTTLPSKCTFEAKEIKLGTATTTAATGTKQAPRVALPLRHFLLCGIPRNPAALQDQPMPDAYEKRAVFTIDDFYEIDLVNGTVRLLVIDEERTIDATNLKIFNRKLFFVNRYDGRLYALALPD